MFEGVYKDKTVLVTGHAGFKGSWLCAWLLEMGAKVVGFSDQVPTEPGLFNLAKLGDRVTDIRADIRDLSAIKAAISDHRPDFVFHLAAQPLVSVSYEDPHQTFSSNVMGTFNVCEALRAVDWPCVAVLITSDKCYDNVEWVWGYRETDAMGGKDVYSGSKGAAELVIRSMVQSFFLSDDCPVKIGVTRAGNVIGGGDWARDRIVVDAVKSWSNGAAVTIRSPNATRPWQHVLEPLSGYLCLGQALASGKQKSGEAFNFGPPAEEIRTVSQLLDALFQHWDKSDEHAAYHVEGMSMHEAGLLKLNCDKALYHLGWTATLNFDDVARMTATWYNDYYRHDQDAAKLMAADLDFYIGKARDERKVWA